MQTLPVTHFAAVKPIFKVMDDHLAVSAALAGAVSTQVYVDDRLDPKSGLISAYNRRFFLAGDSQNQEFNRALAKHFAQVVLPLGIQEKQDMFVLYYAPGEWAGIIPTFLPDRHPITAQRQYLEFKNATGDWRAMLPDGFSLQLVDKELVSDNRIKDIDLLREEMCSERSSVDDFLGNSFGVCLITNEQLVGWCLSEYNTQNACEIGIATLQPFQRRGLATAMGLAFVERAHAQGLQRIGWHCNSSNQASMATALKIGFEKVCDYPVVMEWYEKSLSLAVNGNVCFDRGEYTEAQAFLEQAIEHGANQGWVFWVAGLAANMNQQHAKAFQYLAQSVEKGFATRERLEKSKYLVSLHDTSEWKSLVGI